MADRVNRRNAIDCGLVTLATAGGLPLWAVALVGYAFVRGRSRLGF